MININELQLQLNEELEDYEEVIRNVKTILTTPKGTVPFDREFGIDWSIVDQPMARAKSLLAAEYAKQIRKYEPRVRVREVNYETKTTEAQDGILVPKVVLESG
jgi:hypothetical protein